MSKWTDSETVTLVADFQKKPSWMPVHEFCQKWGSPRGRSADSVERQLRRLQCNIGKIYVQPSPYPKYDTPLTLEGDALILSDLEFPYHNAEFVNRCMELAEAWGIRQCILAGDVIHFDSLSGWEPNWTTSNTGGITAEAEQKLTAFAQTLSAKQQGKFFELLGNIGDRKEQDGLSTELDVARAGLKRIIAQFDHIDFVLGNHEGRLLRALEVTINPDELLRLLDAKNPKMRIAPYYYSYLDTQCGRYQIEHPKGASEGTAQQLAAKYHSHVIMGHSHLLDFSWDISGEFYAIHAGHCVDETRLPYAAQRHTTRRAHKPGAVIVMDGYPYLLHWRTDWERMKRIV